VIPAAQFQADLILTFVVFAGFPVGEATNADPVQSAVLRLSAQPRSGERIKPTA
jgi:hypothetical protein